MGNCCRAAPSSMEWGGENWDYLKSDNNNSNNNKKKTKNTRPSNKVFDEAQGGLHTLAGNAQKDSNGATTVKIRISKKELKELLGESSSSGILIEKKKQDDEQIMMKKRVARASAEQVLLRLLKASRDYDYDLQRPWKPVLESIPEVN